MAAFRKLSLLALIAAVCAAFLAPTAEAVYYGRVAVVGGRGFYGRNRYVAGYSRWGRGFYGRHLLADDEEASAPEEEQTVEEPASDEPAASDCVTLSALLESRSDEFSLLMKAIEKLPQEFKDEMTARADESDFTYTFFAPTDDAITRFTEWIGEEVEDSEMVKNGTAALAILSYHIVPEVAAKSTDLTNDQMLVTALGEEFPLKVQLDDEGVTLLGIGSSAKVIEADLPTCKGVVHVIDDVLLPADGDGEIDDDQQLKSAVKEEIDRLVEENASSEE